MILVAGSANLDFVVRAAHLPAPGETVLGRSFQTFPGGKGANQAVACARAGGVPTAMLLAVGNDLYAQPVLDSLIEAGVLLHLVRSLAEPTGTAFICVSDSGENAITVAPGANNALLPEHLALHCPSLQGFSHLLMQLETPLPTLLAFAAQARAQGVVVVLNAAPAAPYGAPLLAKLLSLVDILIVNEGELAALCPNDFAPGAGEPNPKSASMHQKLLQVPVPCVVVTLGAEGCVAKVPDAAGAGFTSQQAYRVNVVDTTAAGDTFCGTLVAALSQGQPMSAAMQTASAAAALACTQMGAQSSIPARTAVQKMMQQ